MTDRERKRTVVCISSSSSSEHDESEEEEDDDDYEAEESSGDDDRDGGGIGADDDDDADDNDDLESIYRRVVILLQEGINLEALNVKECKAYLRKHRLRLSCTKEVCIQRIKEHWRIKDGNGEELYPRSSFVINCTGDVCKGDVVLFTQKVYKKFNKLKRHGKHMGTRTVAGRVVKESYGSTKQQHTFTVEVLWSKGAKKLCPLFPLLVKGRNLYKFRTFRQHWNNEAERQIVLAEKHKRGTAARQVRAMKKSNKICSVNGGVKHQKCFHHTRPSQLRKTAEPEKRIHVVGHSKDTLLQEENLNNYLPLLSRQREFKSNARSEGFKTAKRHKQIGHRNVDVGSPTFQSWISTSQDPHLFTIEPHPNRVPFSLSGYDMGST